MRNPQHTPGPWFVRRHDKPTHPDLPTFDVLAPNEDFGKPGVPHAGAHVAIAIWLDSEANARLIAAAPDLLAALDHVLALYVGERVAHGYAREIVEADRFVMKAREAIANARGRDVP